MSAITSAAALNLFAQKGWLHRDNLFRAGSQRRVFPRALVWRAEAFSIGAGRGPGRCREAGRLRALLCQELQGGSLPGHHLQSPARPLPSPRGERFPRFLHKEMNSFSAFLPGPWGSPSKIRSVQMLYTQKLSDQQKLHLVKLVFF